MKYIGRIVLMFIGGFALSFAGTISLQPSASTVALGSPLSVDVNVAGLNDLFAFEFDIYFDPAIVSSSTITEGSLFSSVGISFSPGLVDNVGGTITFIGDSLSGPGPGIGTDGTLAQILFSTIGTGSGSLDLTNVIFLDSNFSAINATVSGTKFTVTGNGVPEPASWLLGALGGGLLILLRSLR